MASQQAGNLQRAVHCYQKYLKEVPDTAPVLHALGGLCYQLQRHDLAGKYLEQACQKDPGNPDYLNDLGAFLLTTGKYNEAVSSLGQIVSRSPDNPEAYYNLGLALHGADRLSEALSSFDEVIKLRPDHAAAYYNMGVILQELGQYPGAEETLRKAVRYAPDLAVAHLKLGEVLSSQKREDSAFSSFQKAYEQDRNNLNIVLGYAGALHNTGRTEEGIRILRGQLEKYPDDISIITLLGQLLHIAGHIDEAEEVFRSGLLKKQIHSGICLEYSRIRKFSTADADVIKKMETALGDTSLSDTDRGNICFALGKIYDDCSEYDKAFDRFAKANTIAHKIVKYDRTAYEKEINNNISVFTRDFFSEFSSLGTDMERPVFIVGMPRSGTTLTEQILVSHPEVAGGGELSYFTGICTNLHKIVGNKDAYPYCCKFLNKKNADTIIRQYLELLERHSVTARFVTDKMPNNFLYLGLMRLLFPKAPVIYCRRDPLDACLSIYFQYFSKHHKYSFDLMDIGHYYMDHVRLMSQWKKVLPGPMLEVQYEDLVAEPEKNSRRLIEFCGLEWDPACLEFYNKKRDVRTASNWQVRQPIYASSVRRWKNYEKYLGPLMQLFNEIKDE